MKLIASLIGYLLAVFVVGQVWWYMWMHYGWVGTPKLLHKFFFADGEASFNLTLIEMLIISALVLGAIVGVLLLRKDRANRTGDI
jgi:hypothetical protein